MTTPEWVQCSRCLEIVDASIAEPCWCVFSGDGELINGVFHTAERIPVDENVREVELLAQEVEAQLAYNKGKIWG